MKKFVVALNRNQPLPAQLNALAHVVLGLISQISDVKEMQFTDFKVEDGQLVSTLTDFPFIILSAKKNIHLKKFHQNLIEANLPRNAFFLNMITGTVEEQKNQIKGLSLDELEYIAVTAFGTVEEINPLTKRFELYKVFDNKSD